MTARDFYSKAFVLRSYSGCFPAMGGKKISLEPSCLSPFRRWHVLSLMSILANMGYNVTNSSVLFWVLTAHCWQRIADSAFRKSDITFVWEAGLCSLEHRYQCRREMCCFHLQVIDRSDGSLTFSYSRQHKILRAQEEPVWSVDTWLKSRNPGSIIGNAKRYFSTHKCPYWLWVLLFSGYKEPLP
jgi:hypothetical protein